MHKSRKEIECGEQMDDEAQEIQVKKLLQRNAHTSVHKIHKQQLEMWGHTWGISDMRKWENGGWLYQRKAFSNRLQHRHTHTHTRTSVRILYSLHEAPSGMLLTEHCQVYVFKSFRIELLALMPSFLCIHMKAHRCCTSGLTSKQLSLDLKMVGKLLKRHLIYNYVYNLIVYMVSNFFVFCSPRQSKLRNFFQLSFKKFTTFF